MQYKIHRNVEELTEKFPLLYGEKTEEQKIRYKNLLDKFNKSFNADGAYFASSSGRVEVCGNHTDHNGGRVVSCAISLDTLAAFLPTKDGVITIKSEGYKDIVVDISGEEKEKKGTSDALVRGVVVGLRNRGFQTGGFCACFTSSVLGGAGISSSASFEVLVAEILNFLYNDEKISMEDKAKIAQFSESQYFGKPCGLLDQTAISFGGLKRLDFKDKNKIDVTKINNVLSEYTLVLVNTGGSHANLTDEYAAIPKEMFSVANAMGKDRLIDIPEEEFYKNLLDISDKVKDRAVLRAIHFYNENKRVDAVADALNNEQYDKFLAAINGSGISSLCKLQNCFVAGSDNQPIPKALAICERYLSGGANRVHGGGFAGTILNIVKNDNLKGFLDNVTAFFGKENVIPLKVRELGTTIL